MEDEKRWTLITDIVTKLALQINSLIDICEKQQEIIGRLEERIEDLEVAGDKIY